MQLKAGISFCGHESRLELGQLTQTWVPIYERDLLSYKSLKTIFEKLALCINKRLKLIVKHLNDLRKESFATKDWP